MLDALITNNYAPEDRGDAYFIAWENIGLRAAQLRAIVYGHKISNTQGGMLIAKSEG